MRLAVLSVYDRHPELLADHLARLRLCAGPAREALGAELRLAAIVHAGTRRPVLEAVRSGCAGSGGLAACIDLRKAPPEVVPGHGPLSHGHGLAEAYRALCRDGLLGPDDLVATLDHDAHPLRTDLFARLGSLLLAEPDLAGIGIPQWYHGRCYLHPSLLLTRAALIEEMGPETAFQATRPASPGSEWHDTCEGFTIWCERHGRRILPLRVLSTGFPFARWDSDMAPDGGTELTGWHGERVRVGHLMRFGLEPERPLVSHLWAGFLGPYQEDGFSPWTWKEVLAAYLAEPLTESSAATPRASGSPRAARPPRSTTRAGS